MKNPACPKPTTQQLAMIVAQLLPSCAGDLSKATADAVRVWEACGSEIETWPERIARRKAEADELVAQEKEFKALQKEAPMNSPKGKSHFRNLIQLLDFLNPTGMTQSRPVLFEKALIWIMPNVAPTKRMEKFRKALMVADGVDNFKAGKCIAELKKREWFIEQQKALAAFFNRHWKNHLSRIRSGAGGKGGRPENNPEKPLTEFTGA